MHRDRSRNSVWRGHFIFHFPFCLDWPLPCGLINVVGIFEREENDSLFIHALISLLSAFSHAEIDINKQNIWGVGGTCPTVDPPLSVHVVVKSVCLTTWCWCCEFHEIQRFELGKGCVQILTAWLLAVQFSVQGLEC